MIERIKKDLRLKPTSRLKRRSCFLLPFKGLSERPEPVPPGRVDDLSSIKKMDKLLPFAISLYESTVVHVKQVSVSNFISILLQYRGLLVFLHALPSIAHIFRKAQEPVDADFLAVVQNKRACIIAKNLILN